MALVGEELVMYLANLVSVARIDGSVSPKKSEAVARIQKRMGAKKTELNKAMKLAERDDYKIEPIGHFTDKVQNLEDLLYVSVVDGEIHAQEETIIVNFAKDIGVTQDQLNLIMGDINRLLASGTARSSCRACDAEVPVITRFCAKCGAAVSMADS
ncbi:MAG: TerB family tellurite resistance protein [Syntrophobacteria bacterium]